MAKKISKSKSKIRSKAKETKADVSKEFIEENKLIKKEKLIEKEFAKTYDNVRKLIIFMAVVMILAFIVLFIIAISNNGKNNPVIDTNCSDIQNNAEKDICYLNEANKKGSLLHCNEISNEIIKDPCVADIAIANANASMCAGLAIQTNGYCIKKIADKTKDVQLCDNIEASNWKDLCFYSLSNITEDYNLCTKVSYPTRDDCYSDFAESYGFSKVCNKVMNSTLQGKCFFNLAIDTANITLCDKTVKNTLQGMCYQHFAYTGDDSALCEPIKIGVIKDSCLEHFSVD